MTVPVLRQVQAQNPGLHLVMVSTEFVRPLFSNIERLVFYAADLKGKHSSINGLFQLYRELNAQFRFDAVADLHNVLRTKILRGFLKLSFKPTAVIDKGRKEKKELTRQVDKRLRPLKSTFQRYADVFNELGVTVSLENEMNKFLKVSSSSPARHIGIAPFALHPEKCYPESQMKKVITLLTEHDHLNLYLLGGKADSQKLEEWASGLQRVKNIAGTMSFAEELTFIATLDLVVSMDSANMHIASLLNVPVISIWGGTHPYLGFYGWRQRPANAIQIDLPCRPSSVFGNKPCPNQLACMHGIDAGMIVNKILKEINQAS